MKRLLDRPTWPERALHVVAPIIVPAVLGLARFVGRRVERVLLERTALGNIRSLS